MALLRIPLGCLASTIFRLAAIAAVGVLVYLLIVKPGLNKADEALNSGTGAAHRLSRCIGQAHGDVQRLERCAQRF